MFLKSCLIIRDRRFLVGCLANFIIAFFITIYELKQEKLTLISYSIIISLSRFFHYCYSKIIFLFVLFGSVSSFSATWSKVCLNSTLSTWKHLWYSNLGAMYFRPSSAPQSNDVTVNHSTASVSVSPQTCCHVINGFQCFYSCQTPSVWQRFTLFACLFNEHEEYSTYSFNIYQYFNKHILLLFWMPLLCIICLLFVRKAVRAYFIWRYRVVG